MRVVQDLGEIDRDDIAAVVITGDGGGEFRRLKTIASRFGSGEVLWFPQRSERYLGRDVGIEVPGFEALRILELYKSTFYQYDFLFLLDNKHVSGDPSEELADKLDEACPQGGVEVTAINGDAYRCRCLIGSQNITIRTAMIGDRFGFMEDCIAELLALVWGNQITADEKEAFKNRVNNTVAGSTFRSLVADAEEDDLRQAFPALSAVLDDLVEDHDRQYN